jgi:hypothetical protein
MINMVLETCPGKKISKALSSGWNPWVPAKGGAMEGSNQLLLPLGVVTHPNALLKVYEAILEWELWRSCRCCRKLCNQGLSLGIRMVAFHYIRTPLRGSYWNGTTYTAVMLAPGQSIGSAILTALLVYNAVTKEE